MLLSSKSFPFQILTSGSGLGMVRPGWTTWSLLSGTRETKTRKRMFSPRNVITYTSTSIYCETSFVYFDRLLGPVRREGLTVVCLTVYWDLHIFVPTFMHIYVNFIPNFLYNPLSNLLCNGKFGWISRTLSVANFALHFYWIYRQSPIFSLVTKNIF